jgi:glycogenin
MGGVHEVSSKPSAYVTLLSSDSYLEGVLTLNESLRRVRSAYPLDALITEDLSPASRAALERFGIRCHVAASALLMPSAVLEVNEQAGLSNWSATLGKLQVFGLTQYRRIVFLDSDMIALENLDHLFSAPHMSAVIAARSVPGEEEKCPSLNSGLMVIEPVQDLPDQLGEHLARVIARGYPMGDQDLLHSFYP